MDDTQRPAWQRRTILFLISQCITLFGSTLVQMALVWYATMQTSSGTWVAAFTVCSYLPQFLISFFAGVWADRYSRKRLIICADALIALVTLLMMLAIPHIPSEPALLGGLLLMSVIRSLGAMYSGFLPLGMILFGPLADVMPLQWTMIGSGLALILLAGMICVSQYSRAD